MTAKKVFKFVFLVLVAIASTTLTTRMSDSVVELLPNSYKAIYMVAGMFQYVILSVLMDVFFNKRGEQ